MSTLTAEQRKRMEENRKKALEKLSLLKAASGRPMGAGPPSNSGKADVFQSSSTYENPLTKASNQAPTNTNSQSSFGSNVKPPEKAASSHPGSLQSPSKSGGSGSVFMSSSSFTNPLSKGNQSAPPAGCSSSSGLLEKAGHANSGLPQPKCSAAVPQSSNNAHVPLSEGHSKPTTKFIGLEAAQRMEENRRKALEKRAATGFYTSTSSENNPNNVSKSPQFGKKSATDFYKGSSNATGETTLANKAQGSNFTPSSASSSSYKQNTKNLFGSSSSGFGKQGSCSSGFGKPNPSAFRDHSSPSKDGLSREEKMIESVLNKFDDGKLIGNFN